MNLSEVIEDIGRVDDSTESGRWDTAEKIAVAYAEFGAYEAGLTKGLAERLGKSDDTVYGYRDAAVLRERLKVGRVLHLSHFVTLSHSVTRYGLADETVHEWIDRALVDRLNVIQLREAIANEHTADLLAAWLKRVRSGQRMFGRVFEDAESIHLPDDQYQALKVVCSAINDFAESLHSA